MNERQTNSPEIEITDAAGMIVMPGFVNTHTHVPMTLLRGFADDLPLHEWLTEHIFPAEARLVTPGKRSAIASPVGFYRDDQIGYDLFQRHVLF